MYTLRTVTESNKEINTAIGNTYSIVHRDLCHDEFCDIYKYQFGELYVSDSNDNSKRCFAFLQGTIDVTIPLYGNNNYYIMTESGKTFNKLNTLAFSL